MKGPGMKREIIWSRVVGLILIPLAVWIAIWAALNP